MTSDDPQAGPPPAPPAPASDPEPVIAPLPPEPPEPPQQPQPPAPSPAKARKGLIGALIAGGIILAGIAFKYVLPMVLVGTVSGALGTVFGGPYAKLPADQQRDLDQRYMVAIGEQIKSLPEAEQSTRITAAIDGGLPRLADDLLVERFTLGAQMLEATDVATCARMARASQTGIEDVQALETAIGALPVAGIGRWYEINLQAIEAEAAGTPSARTVGDAEVEGLWTTMFESMDQAEVEMIATLAEPGAGDEDACGGMRALYSHVLALPPSDVVLMARYDISP